MVLPYFSIWNSPHSYQPMAGNMVYLVDVVFAVHNPESSSELWIKGERTWTAAGFFLLYTIVGKQFGKIPKYSVVRAWANLPWAHLGLGLN